MSTHRSPRKRIAVIGGGASGMFAATAAASYVQKHDIDGCDVVVFEGTSKTMQKVRISGGGRCNGKLGNSNNATAVSFILYSRITYIMLCLAISYA